MQTLLLPRRIAYSKIDLLINNSIDITVVVINVDRYSSCICTSDTAEKAVITLSVVTEEKTTRFQCWLYFTQIVSTILLDWPGFCFDFPRFDKNLNFPYSSPKGSFSRNRRKFKISLLSRDSLCLQRDALKVSNLNFRKSKVALNPPGKHFLNFLKLKSFQLVQFHDKKWGSPSRF